MMKYPRDGETSEFRENGILKTEPLHTLWSKAVGTDTYVKQEWRELSAMVEAGQVAREKAALARGFSPAPGPLPRGPMIEFSDPD